MRWSTKWTRLFSSIQRGTTLKGKLLTGFGAIIVLLAALGLIAIWQLVATSRITTNLTAGEIPSIALIGEISSNASKLDATILSMQLSTDVKEREKKAAAYSDLSGLLAKQLADFKGFLHSSEEEAAYVQLMDMWKTYAERLQTIVRLLQANASASQVTHFVANAQQTLDEFQRDLTALKELNKRSADQAADRLNQSVKSSITLLLVVMAVSAVAAVAIAFVISRNISAPLRLLSQRFEQIAAGDLRGKELDVGTRKDEIGQLAASFQHMNVSLRSLIEGVGASSEQVAAAGSQLNHTSSSSSAVSREIASAMQEIAAGSEQQRASVSEVSRAVEEMGDGINSVAENASEIAETADIAKEHAAQGEQSVKGVADQMNSIHGSVVHTEEVIRSLAKKSREIGSIVTAIREIASQTNLLSLNASIEAARAGEHGRGFAVVADEIRKLADQSGTMSDHIGKLLSDITKDIGSTDQSIDQVKREVLGGMDAARATERSFLTISDSTLRIVTQIQEMAATSQQMAAGAEQIRASVQTIAHIASDSADNTIRVSQSAQQQLASMLEVERSAAELARCSGELQGLIRRFVV